MIEAALRSLPERTHDDDGGEIGSAHRGQNKLFPRRVSTRPAMLHLGRAITFQM